MENKKSNNGILALLVIFIILTLLFGGYILYDKVLSKNDTAENSNTNIDTPTQGETIVAHNYTYDEIAGYYTAEIQETEEESTKYYLYLYENGTFSFTWRYKTLLGDIGNYIIKDNQIVLNPLYDINSGAGKTKSTNEPTALTINQDGTLDTDGDILRQITLSKSNDNSTENWFNHYLSYKED